MDAIVLAHGYLGFLGELGWEYYVGVKAHLEKTFPGLTVLQTHVDPDGPVAVRAAQLVKQIQAGLKPGQRAHIIAHSMGGIDGRYLLSPAGLHRSDLVASLTTISSPHWGTPLADIVVSNQALISKGVLKNYLERLAAHIQASALTTLGDWDRLRRYLAGLFGLRETGIPDLTIPAMRVFNTKYPDAPGVAYYSYAGVTGLGEKDPWAGVLSVPYLIILNWPDERAGGRNDGLVSVNSARWGTFKGELPADHANEIGWDVSLLSRLQFRVTGQRTFDHIAFYARVVRELIGV